MCFCTYKRLVYAILSSILPTQEVLCHSLNISKESIVCNVRTFHIGINRVIPRGCLLGCLLALSSHIYICITIGEHMQLIRQHKATKKNHSFCFQSELLGCLLTLLRSFALCEVYSVYCDFFYDSICILLGDLVVKLIFEASPRFSKHLNPIVKYENECGFITVILQTHTQRR